MRPLYFIISAILLASCAPKATSEEAQTQAMLDTLTYDEADYNRMIAYFKSDTLIQRTLKENLTNGDLSSHKLQRLLDTDYNNRHQSGYSERDIDVLMLSFFSMQSVLNKFDKIQQSLDSLNLTQDPQKVLDSLEAVDSIDFYVH